MARDASADGEVGAAIDQQLGDFGVHAFEMRQGMEDRSLTADAAGVHVGAGVNVGAVIEEKARGVEEAVFCGDVKECCPPEGEQAAAGRTAIQLRVAAMDERRVGIEEGGEFVGAAAENREHTRHVVAGVGADGQKHLDAGREVLRVARVCLDDVIKGGDRISISWVAAVGVGTVIEEPTQRFRFEILARCEENWEPAPGEGMSR